MDIIKPLETKLFRIFPKNSTTKYGKASNFFENKIKDEYMLCLDITREELDDLFQKTKNIGIVYGEDRKLLSFILTSSIDRYENVHVYYTCGDERYISEFIQLIQKRIDSSIIIDNENK